MKKFTLLAIALFWAVFAIGQQLDPDPNLNSDGMLKVYDEDFEDEDLSDWTLIKEVTNNFPGWHRHYDLGICKTGGFLYHADDNNGRVSTDWAISPAIEITSEGEILEIAHLGRFTSYGHDPKEIVILSSNENPESSILATLYSKITLPANSPLTETLKWNLTQFNGQTIYIGFKYTGNYADGWGIDDIAVYKNSAHNVGISSNVNQYVGLDPVQVKGNLMGTGNSAETNIPCTVEIKKGETTVTTLNATVAEIAKGETKEIDFGTWTPTEAGEYTLTFTATLDTDDYLPDNTATATVNVIEGLAWGGNINTGNPADGRILSSMHGENMNFAFEDFMLTGDASKKHIITEVKVKGEYSKIAPDELLLMIFENDNNEPGEDPVFSTSFPYTKDFQETGSLKLADPCVLEGGKKYWITVVGSYDEIANPAQGAWYWKVWNTKTPALSTALVGVGDNAADMVLTPLNEKTISGGPYYRTEFAMYSKDNAVVLPENTEFLTNSGETPRVYVNVISLIETISGIKKGGTALAAGTDFTVEDNEDNENAKTVKFTETFLASLTEKTKLTVSLSAGTKLDFYLTPKRLAIKSVAKLSDINATKGTAFAGLNLPTEVDVTFTNGMAGKVPVTFDETKYDATLAVQTLKGTLQIGNLLNPYDFVTADVKVFLKEVETGVAGINENFNTNSVLPNGWSQGKGILKEENTVVKNDYTSWQVVAFANDYSNDSGRKINIYGSYRSDWLISPAVNLDAISADKRKLYFDVAATKYGNAAPYDGFGSDDKFYVVVSKDNGVTWAKTDVVFPENDNFGIITGERQTMTVDLKDYSGTVKIGFYAESTENNADFDLHIDNVVLGDFNEVNFTVNDVMGNPIAGAAIEFANGTTVKTDAMGKVSTLMANGTYKAVVYKEGFATKEDQEVVVSGVTNVKFELNTVYTLKLVVQNATDKSKISNPSIKLKDVETGEMIVEGQGPSSGEATISQLPNGLYEYEVAKMGFVTQTKQIAITGANKVDTVRLATDTPNLVAKEDYSNTQLSYIKGMTVDAPKTNFQFANIGGGTVSIGPDQITLTGTDADKFTLKNVPTDAVVLPTGSFINLGVQAVNPAALAVGTYTAQFNLKVSDDDTRTIDVTLNVTDRNVVQVADFDKLLDPTVATWYSSTKDKYNPTKWYIKEGRMFVSTDGENNLYDEDHTLIVTNVVNVELPVMAENEYELSFEIKCIGEVANWGTPKDFVRPFLLSDNKDIYDVNSTFNTASEALVEAIHSKSNYARVTYKLPKLEEAAIKKLAFAWFNDPYGANNEGASIKNLVIRKTQADLKEITNFAFEDLKTVCEINETNISVVVPAGVEYSELVPVISFEGKSVATKNGEAPNFNAPVVYTVTAEDGTTKDYTVTVTEQDPVAVNFTFTDGINTIDVLKININGVERPVTNLKLNPGTYQYTVNEEYFLPASGEITVGVIPVNKEVTLTRVNEVTIATSVANVPVKLGDKTVVTNDEGKAVFTGLVDGDYTFNVLGSAAGYDDQDVQVTVSGNNIEKTVTLTPVNKNVTFTLVNANGSGVLKGLDIIFNGVTKTSNTEGKLTFNDVAPGEYTIQIVIDGYSFKTVTFEVLGEDLMKTIALEKVQKVKFKVLAEDNNALTGATVMLDGFSMEASAGADNNEVAFMGVSAGTHQYKVTLSDNYAIEEGTVEVTNEDLTKAVTLKQQKVVTFTVKNEAAEAVEGATIQIKKGEETQTLTTNETGMATVTLLNGDYTYEVTKADHETIADQALTLSYSNPFQAAAPVNVTLNRSKHTVTFVAKDGETALKDVAIAFNGGTLTTNDEGKATAEVISGTYDYTATLANYTTVTNQVVVAGADVEVPVAMSNAQDITFHVKTGSDNIEGAEVNITDMPNTKGATDVAGNVTLKLTPGDHNYTVTKDGFEVATGTVTVVFGTPQTIEVELTHVYTVTLTFKDKDSGETLQGVFVTIGNESRTTDENGQITIKLKDGGYSYKAVLAGYNTIEAGPFNVAGADVNQDVQLEKTKYKVTFKAKSGETEVTDFALVLDGATHNPTAGKVELDLIPGNYTLNLTANGYAPVSDFAFEVTDADKEVVVELQKYYSITFSAETEGLTDFHVVFDNDPTDHPSGSSSSVTVENLVAGEYDYTATKDGYTTVQGTVTITDQDVTENIGANFHKLFTQVFNVKDAENNPVAEATVTVFNEDGEELIDVLTSTDGTASLIGVAGTYHYTVTKDGYKTVTGDVTIAEDATTVPAIDVTMVTTKALTVVVKDASDSHLLGSSVVKVYEGADATGTLVETKTTGLEGQVVFNLIPGRNYFITVTNPTYDGAEKAITNFNADATEEFLLTEKTHTVTFTVTENGKNTALADFPVKVVNKATNAEIIVNTTTEGKAIFNLKEGNFTYEIAKEGYQTVTGEFTVFTEDVTKDVSINKYYTAQFTVTDGSNPLRAKVTLEGANLDEALTDSTLATNGTLTFENLINGEYTYTVELENSITSGKTSYKLATGTITIENGDVTEAVTLTPMYIVAISVVDENDNGIDGVTIEISKDNTLISTFTSTLTGINFQDVAGTYTFVAKKEGFEDKTGEFTIGSANTEKEIVMVAKLFTVTFTAKEGENLLKDVAVAIEGQNTPLTTNANGVATIELKNGDYNYTATLENYQTVTGSFTVANDVVAVDLPMVSTHTLTLKFNDGENPLQGVSVAINNQTLTTDENGVVTVDLIDGDYPYTATLAGYADANGTITMAGEDKEGTISLVKTITLTYKVTADGQPMENVIVKTTNEAGVDAYLMTLTDGTISKVMKAGKYTYETSIVTGYAVVRGEFELTKDTTIAIELKAAQEVKFVVADPTGAKLKDVEITAYGETKKTNDSGEAIFSLANGEYEFTATKDGYGTVGGTVTVDGSTVKEITMSQLQDVTFTVKEGETNLKDAKITVNNLTATTDENGAAKVKLSNGEYPYTVELEGYQTATGTVTVNGEAVTVDVNMVKVYTVTFTVKEGTTPLKDVAISINNETLTTDANGMAKTTLVKGDYPYTAKLATYKDATGDVKVDNKDVEVAIAMEKAEVPTYTVTFGVQGEGGTVAATANGQAINSGDKVAKGTRVEFTATPADGYQVKDWIYNGASTEMSNVAVVIKSLGGDANVLAVFEKIPSGINDASRTAFNVYPNPANDFVSVTVDGNSVITIYDLSGKIVMKQNVTSNTNRIDVSSFAKGVYIVKAQNENGTVSSSKLIIK